MSSLTRENLLSLQQAARMMPPGRRSKPTHVSTLLRWILNGVKAASGQTVRLEAVRLGGRWLTSAEALDRFAAGLTPDLDRRPELPRSLAQRQRASERAAEQVRQLGI